MLYRVSPPGDVTWIDVPSRGTLRLAQENDLDLAGLAWKPAEARTFSNNFLRLAVRYGIPCSDGIVVSAIDIVDLGRSDELRFLNHQSAELHAELRPQGEFMEKFIPGWVAHGEKLDRRISDSMERTAREADDDLAQQLATPPKTDLIEHWRRLGGDLPNPL